MTPRGLENSLYKNHKNKGEMPLLGLNTGNTKAMKFTNLTLYTHKKNTLFLLPNTTDEYQGYNICR